MEVYVLLGLVSLGYMFTKKDANREKMVPGEQQSMGSQTVSTRNQELPVHRRYEPQMTVEDVRSMEMMKAQDQERAARFPLSTGEIDPRASVYNDNPVDKEGYVHSDIADASFTARDFRHNNMQPFFGSHVKNVYGSDNQALLETFTGAAGVGNSMQKQEVSPMFNPEESSSGVFGNQAYTSAMQDRFSELESANHTYNGELPFEQVKVGRGVGQGFTSTPTGGFAQNQDREHVMARYKDVDELRPGNNPKANLEGRLNAGFAPGGRVGKMGQASKNRPQTSFDIGEFGNVPTRGAIDKETSRSDPVHGRAMRDPPSAFRMEAAGSTINKMPEHIGAGQALKISDPKLTQQAPALTGVGRTGTGNTRAEESHRSHQPLGDNERTTDIRMAGEAFQISSGPPGAVRARGSDVRHHVTSEGMRLSGKEHTSDAGDSHMFGIMSPQMPSRGPAYDPMMHRARTTMKETQIHEAHLGNYKNEHGVVGDEGESTRHTVREGFPDTYDPMNVHPPMLQEGVGTGGADPRTHMPPTTTRETTSVSKRFGSANPANPPGAYSVTPAGKEEARPTSRQVTGQVEYFGPGGRPDKHGYSVADGNLRENMTMSRDALSDFEYFGIAKSKNDKGVDYESVYATTLNEAKQSMLETRAPGGHGRGGKRIPNAAAQGGVNARKDDRLDTGYTNAPESLPKSRGDIGSVAFQSNKGLHHNDRIDEQLLSYLKSNPLVINPAVNLHRSTL